MSDFTHDELVERAAKWLRRSCSVVITDMTHGGEETADAIGWQGMRSIVIECKVSRSDFLADGKKAFRKYPARGMGLYRYYMAPRGLIKPDELPKNWGLLEVYPKQVREVVKPAHWFGNRNQRSEISLLLSALKRVGQDPPPGVSVRCYQYDNKRRATLGIAADPSTDIWKRLRANHTFKEPAGGGAFRVGFKVDHQSFHLHQDPELMESDPEEFGLVQSEWTRDQLAHALHRLLQQEHEIERQ